MVQEFGQKKVFLVPFWVFSWFLRENSFKKFAKMFFQFFLFLCCQGGKSTCLVHFDFSNQKIGSGSYRQNVSFIYFGPLTNHENIHIFRDTI